MHAPYGQNNQKHRRLTTYPSVKTATDPNILDHLQKERARTIRNLSGLARFMLHTRAVTMWQDGSGTAHVLNWWNPIAWIWTIVALVAVFISGGVAGVRQELDGIGLVMKPYWRERKDERVFITARDL